MVFIGSRSISKDVDGDLLFGDLLFGDLRNVFGDLRNGGIKNIGEHRGITWKVTWQNSCVDKKLKGKIFLNGFVRK